MQLFVRGLNSKSIACEVNSDCCVAELKQRVEDVHGLPSCSQGLIYAGRQLQDERCLKDYGVEEHSTIHLVLRLRGGKGGFGALLRGLGRDGSKTTNDDAMRDLQGRRMRHANAEKKMKDWEAKAKERELEKLALQHIKQQERQARREQQDKVEVDSIVAAQKSAVAGVQDAVQSALAEAKKAPNGSSSGANGAAAAAGQALPGKRAASGAGTAASARGPGPAPKRSRMMAALESFGSEDEDESESSSEEEEEGGAA